MGFAGESFEAGVDGSAFAALALAGVDGFVRGELGGGMSSGVRDRFAGVADARVCDRVARVAIVTVRRSSLSGRGAGSAERL